HDAAGIISCPFSPFAYNKQPFTTVARRENMTGHTTRADHDRPVNQRSVTGYRNHHQQQQTP
ncbi:TPA: hypothetical protein ACIYNS_005711, partial [Escherichia coli]